MEPTTNPFRHKVEIYTDADGQKRTLNQHIRHRMPFRLSKFERRCVRKATRSINHNRKVQELFK
jgi:hypothetical protein